MCHIVKYTCITDEQYEISMGELYYPKQKSVVCRKPIAFYLSIYLFIFAKFDLLFYFRGKRKIERNRKDSYHCFAY